MKSFQFYSALLLALSLQGCGSGDEGHDSIAQIKVYKYDGSVQCDVAGIAPEVMRQELINAGIDVICSQKGSDGLLYAASCGQGTGAINIYTIHSPNLIDAEALGYRNVTELTEYSDTPCEQ